MSMWDPLGSPCLTNSALDTWHTVSHSPHAKYLAPLSCFEKHEIPAVSKFDEIRRGSYITRDDSNGEVRFVIRDLEKFQILTEITILPFFRKLGFSQGFTIKIK